jgi:hypothetical protein
MTKQINTMAILALLLLAAVPAAGQFVMDKGITVAESLGAERVTGTCAGWNLAAPVGAWSCASTTITRTASGANLTITDAAATVTAGTTYKIVWAIPTLTAGSFQLSVGGVTLPIRYDAGTYVEYVTAVSTAAPVITAIAASAGTITSTISIKPITSGLTTSDDMNLPLFGGSARLYVNDTDDWFMLNVYSDKTGGNFRMHNFSHPTGDSAVPNGYNLFIGSGAGNFTVGSTAAGVDTASYNVGIGAGVMSSLTTGYRGTAIGHTAADAVTTGFHYFAGGFDAGGAITTADSWVAIGFSAANASTVSGSFVAIGHDALGTASTQAVGSVAVGREALLSASTGTGQHTAVGAYSLFGLTTGAASNSGFGYMSGRYLADGSTANQTPTTCTYLGALTKSSAVGQSNETVIGYDAIGKGSNTVVIGDDNVTDVWMSEDGGATAVTNQIKGNGTSLNVWSGGNYGITFQTNASPATRLTVENTAVTVGALLYGSGTIGQRGFLVGILNRTSDAAETDAFSQSVVTNAGATALVTRTLPTAVAGGNFCFYVADADGLKIQAAAGDEIRIGPTATATAGYIRNSTIGSSVCIVAIDATTWAAMNAPNGTWTFDTP